MARQYIKPSLRCHSCIISGTKYCKCRTVRKIHDNKYPLRHVSFVKAYAKKLWKDKENLIALTGAAIKGKPVDSDDQLGSGRRRYKPRKKKRKLDYFD